jgi:hypothetical protein
MDKSAMASLERWLKREFEGDSDLPLIRGAMIACYRRYPERYDNWEGWGRVYEDCVSD